MERTLAEWPPSPKGAGVSEADKKSKGATAACWRCRGKKGFVNVRAWLGVELAKRPALSIISTLALSCAAMAVDDEHQTANYC